MMFQSHSLKVDWYSAIATEDIAMFFRIMESKTMKLNVRSNGKHYVVMANIT
jgi:hypothetical protein